MEGVFQMLEGMERVRMMVDGKVRERITGLHEVRLPSFAYFGEQVCSCITFIGLRLFQLTGARSLPENAQPTCSMSAL